MWSPVVSGDTVYGSVIGHVVSFEGNDAHAIQATVLSRQFNEL